MSHSAATLAEAIKDAMRAKDSERLAVLRALKTAAMNAAIEKGGAGAELDEAEFLAVVRRQIKQRHDAREQFEKAARTELAEKEAREIEILETYLPAPLTDDELSALVDQAVAETGASSKADMGKVMKLLQERTDGRADGRTLSQAILKRLG